MLFLHWLGQINNDRTQYLGEAVGLARRGVVSVLPQGYFPWVPNPTAARHDVTLVKKQVAAIWQRALDQARAPPAAVDTDGGIARVGPRLRRHVRQPGSPTATNRVSALVLQAPDSLWGNWFASVLAGVWTGQARDRLLRALRRARPDRAHLPSLVDTCSSSGPARMSTSPADVRDAFAASSPDAQVKLYERSDHEFTDVARVDRLAFLAEELGLSGH